MTANHDASVCPPDRQVARHAVTIALLAIAVPTILGLGIGRLAIPALSWPGRPTARILDSVSNWDGQWYLEITEHAYRYQANEKSNVAFFPAYPLSVRALSIVGVSPRTGGPLVSNAMFVGAMLLLFAYARGRDGDQQTALLIALVCALYPAGFFFRMAYSESMFLFVSLLFFWLLSRQAPLEVLAIVCGFATAVRPVGICLVAPLFIELWRDAKSPRSFFLHASILAVPATWGIVLFTAYQWDAFGEPFAWMKSQAMWRNTPPVPWPEKLVALVTLKPIWASYIPGTEFYWRQPGQPEFPLLSLRFMNPIFFVAAVVLVLLGGYKRWLNAQELVFSAGLLLIPYITRGYDMCMESQARFTSVVFPMYMVIGILLSKVSRPWQIAYFAVSAILLCAYSAFFTAGYVFI